MNTFCIGCGVIISHGSYCLTCQPKGRNGSTRAWRHLREVVLLRDRHTCEYCGRCPATHVDHVMPVSRGGPTHPDNLVAACADCNLEKGASPHPRPAA